MMRFGVVGIAIFVAGCQTGESPPPGLSDSLMVDALVDVHLADARAERSGESRDSLRAAALDRHGLDTLAFGRALAYYAENPEAYLPLYDEALDRLLREQRPSNTPADSS